jgi:hypothetical protein
MSRLQLGSWLCDPEIFTPRASWTEARINFSRWQNVFKNHFLNENREIRAFASKVLSELAPFINDIKKWLVLVVLEGLRFSRTECLLRRKWQRLSSVLLTRWNKNCSRFQFGQLWSYSCNQCLQTVFETDRPTKITPWYRVFVEKPIVTEPSNGLPVFMGSKGSLPCSQKPVIWS